MRFHYLFLYHLQENAQIVFVKQQRFFILLNLLVGKLFLYLLKIGLRLCFLFYLDEFVVLIHRPSDFDILAPQNVKKLITSI